MFGEYALYCNGKVVGLICDDTLYVKITEEGKKFVGESYKEGTAYNGAKPTMLINESLIEDRQWLTQLMLTTARSLPLPKPKKVKIKEG